LLRNFGAPGFVGFVFLVAAAAVIFVWPRRRAAPQPKPQEAGGTP
jgi:hypothetical protein